MSAEEPPDIVHKLLAEVRLERVAARAREREFDVARHRFLIGRKDGCFFAHCSCNLWTLEAVLSKTEELASAAGEAKHKEHVAKVTAKRFEIGYAGGKCTPVTITEENGGVSHGHICGPRAPRKKCQVCKVNWSVAECDFPIGGLCKKCVGQGYVWDSTGKAKGDPAAFSDEQINCHACAGTGRQMCNARICESCRTHVEPDEDYCPLHARLAGLEPRIKREPCLWTKDPELINRACLRPSCKVIVGPEARVLYFFKRGRAMCLECGRDYLKISSL